MEETIQLPGYSDQSLTFFDLCDRISDDSKAEFLTDFALENKDLTPLEIQFIAMALLHCGYRESGTQVLRDCFDEAKKAQQNTISKITLQFVLNLECFIYRKLLKGKVWMSIQSALTNFPPKLPLLIHALPFPNELKVSLTSLKGNKKGISQRNGNLKFQEVYVMKFR